jgi:hypothetical protein
MFSYTVLLKFGIIVCIIRVSRLVDIEILCVLPVIKAAIKNFVVIF